MSKGGGQGSFAQMQEPGMGMDMGGFGGGGPQPFTGYTPPQTQPIQMEEPVPLGIADNLNTGFIPSRSNDSVVTNMVTGDGQGPRATNIQPMPMPLVNHGPESFDRFSGGLGSKGGRSNPYQTDGIVPPTMRGQPLPGRRQFDPIDQPIARSDPAPQRTSRFTDAEHSAAEAQAREILGLPPKGGGRVYAGGTPYFNEGTGEYRTGGIKPPRGPVKLQPIKMQPMPFEPVLSDGPDFRPPPIPDMPPTPPRRIDVPAIPDEMLEDIQSRGTVGPGGGTRGRTGSFRDAIREFRDEFRYQPMPRREPPIFGPPRNFPFPMPRPPRMPPRQPPRMPGRNTQFQMPFFGSQYGRMNPYQGQFSGYGVPSNMFSFAQPHYQPYVPPPPQPSPPPVMQLPPGQGGNQVFSGAPVAYTPPPPVSFGGGYSGIGGFGRYNLGLAGSQLR